MTEEPIRIDRRELFDPEVDKALARERAGRERVVADTPPATAFRRLLHNPLLYYPVAAMLAAFVCWKLLDGKIVDFPSVRGQVILINADTFDHPGSNTVAITVGSTEVMIDSHVKFIAGAHGEPAIAGVDSIKVGDDIEVSGIAEGGSSSSITRMQAGEIRPGRAGDAGTTGTGEGWAGVLLFPLTAALIAFGLLLAEGISTRNWTRMIVRSLIGSFLAALFALLAFLPAGIFLLISQKVFQSDIHSRGDLGVVTIKDVSAVTFLVITATRSAAWACIGTALGLGMNLVRSTKTQLRNSVIGGALGGALGGAFFDPIDRMFRANLFGSGSLSRAVGLLAVGLSIGIFVALVERLGRDAWLRVRTGPLAGKSFIIYKTPTIIGNAPASDIYLYKDAEIDPRHAQVHRVGAAYEVEDLDSRMGTSVGGQKIRRRRLVSGDQVVIGSTILDFEERQQRTPLA